MDSDIDLLVVRPQGVSAEDGGWNDQLAGLRQAVVTATGNHAGVIELAEEDLDALREERGLILDELRRDAIDLTGIPLRDMLDGAR